MRGCPSIAVGCEVGPPSARRPAIEDRVDAAAECRIWTSITNWPQYLVRHLRDILDNQRQSWEAQNCARRVGDWSAVHPSLCIINYNGEAYLRQSLPAAVDQAEHFSEIVLVDNGSTDGSVALVEREFPMVRLVRLAENRGACGARNAGLRTAKTDLVLFLDNDVVLVEGCVELLIGALRSHPDAAIAAPSVIYANAPDIVQYCGADNHYLGLMIPRQEDVPLAQVDSTVQLTNSVITACFLVDRTRLVDPEPFDELYFIYLDDHDFGIRQRTLGRTILAVPEAHVLHGQGQAGLSIRALGKYSRMRVYLLIRNRWLFLLKNYSLKTLFLLSPVLLLYECAQLVIVIKKGWIREWARAIGWLVTSLPTILAKRRIVQGTRRVPDRSFITGGPVPFRPELIATSLERVAKGALDAVVGAYWKRVAPLI
jgi:GT2 family glycosyltransferase